MDTHKKKIFGIDFDDVLMDSSTAMMAWHNRVYGTTITRAEQYTFDLGVLWGIDQAACRTRIHEFHMSDEEKGYSRSRAQKKLYRNWPRRTTSSSSRRAPTISARAPRCS